MKITFVVRTLNEAAGGGSHYNAIQYIRALKEHGHEVAVHVFYQRGNAIPADIPVTIHEGFGRGIGGERDYLVSLLKSLEPISEVFFLYGADFIWGGGKYRKNGKVPVAVYLDAYLSSMGKVHESSIKMIWYRYKRLLWDKTVGLNDGQYVDRFLPCSPYIGAVYSSFGFPANRFVVLPNIVPNTVEGTIGPRIERKPIQLLYVGRLIYDKGIDLLLEAIATLSTFNVKLTIVGDGDLRSEVERLSKKYSLTVDLVGWVPQSTVGKYYRDADVFVHPARYPDPAPRTIVDALSYALPVIVPRDGGSAWIAGPAGLVFANGNQKDLIRALHLLFSNVDQVRERLASQGVVQAQRFEKEIVYPQLEDILTFVP